MNFSKRKRRPTKNQSLLKLDKWDYDEVKIREKNIISRIKSFIKEVSEFV